MPIQGILHVVTDLVVILERRNVCQPNALIMENHRNVVLFGVKILIAVLDSLVALLAAQSV